MTRFNDFSLFLPFPKDPVTGGLWQLNLESTRRSHDVRISEMTSIAYADYPGFFFYNIVKMQYVQLRNRNFYYRNIAHKFLANYSLLFHMLGKDGRMISRPSDGTCSTRFIAICFSL